MVGFNEKKLIKSVKPYLLKCRPGDYYHALTIVKWVKKIGRGRKDLPILITAGYVHDTGWYNILPSKKGSVGLDTILSYEKKANRSSVKMVNKILKPLGFSKVEILKINRLVRAADKHKSRRADEEVIVDADTLCKLDIKHLTKKFKKADFPRLLVMLEKRFGSGVVKTRIGKENFSKLLTRLRVDMGRL